MAHRTTHRYYVVTTHWIDDQNRLITESTDRVRARTRENAKRLQEKRNAETASLPAILDHKLSPRITSCVWERPEEQAA